MRRIPAALSLACLVVAGCQTTGPGQAAAPAQPAAEAGALPAPDWLPLFTSGPLLCSSHETPVLNRKVRATQGGRMTTSHGTFTLEATWKLTGPNTITRTLPEAGTDTNTIRLNPDGKSLDYLGRYGHYTCAPEAG